MPLTSEQQAFVTEHANALLVAALGRPNSPEAAELGEWIVAGEADRIQLFKEWATQQIADGDEMVASQQARLTKVTNERDVRKPVLEEIAALTRL